MKQVKQITINIPPNSKAEKGFRAYLDEKERFRQWVISGGKKTMDFVAKFDSPISIKK